jgi:hypothetical protein
MNKWITKGGAVALALITVYFIALRFTGWKNSADLDSPPPVLSPAPSSPVPSPSTPATAASAGIQPTAPALPVLPADPPAAASSPGTPGPVKARYSRKPRDLVVEFEVIDGMAVAYGDTILGRPPENFDQSVGLTELDRPQLWLRGEIPYVIKPEVAHPDRVLAAIQMFQQSTGVKFVPLTDQPDAIAFTKSEEHCQSYLGRTGGLQPIFLSEQCAPVDIAHEIMHALGFVHEQSRIDRDQYLSVHWENIEPRYQSQYAMVPEPLMEVYGGSPFDPQSILMYGRHAFALDKQKPTMELKSGAPVHENPKGLSDHDIERVNRLYRE